MPHICRYAAVSITFLEQNEKIIPESDLTSVSMITPGGLLSVSSLGFQSTIMSSLCSHRAFLFKYDKMKTLGK